MIAVFGGKKAPRLRMLCCGWRFRPPPWTRKGLRPPEVFRVLHRIAFDELFSARASGHRAQRLTRKAQPRKELIVNNNLPTRSLREHPDLDQLKPHAKELLQAFDAVEASAVAEVHAHYREEDPADSAPHH